MRSLTRSATTPWIALALGLLLATTAVAQNPTGNLTGRVVSADGDALPGVTIEATSDKLQGSRTTHTGANGSYKLGFLPPGTYQVKYSLEGFSTSVRSVRINAAQDQSSDITLQITEVTEEIVVTSEMETISQTQTGAATYSKDEVEKLAVGRGLDAAVLLAPGVHDTGPSSAPSIAGAMSFENLFMVNGVVINENVRGSILPLYIEDAIQETTTSVNGVSAEYGRFTGGVVNSITKSGGNQLSASLRVNLTNDDWESKTPLSNDRIDDISQSYEGTLGGAFWKDHIWFFGAGRDRSLTGTSQTRAVTNITFPTSDDEERLEIKLTLSPNQSHSIIGSYFDIERSRAGSSFGTFIDLASVNENRTDPQEIVSVNYTGILTPSFFVEAQYSERDFIIGKGAGGVPDLIDGTLMRQRGTGNRFHAPTFCGSCEDEIRNNENALVKGSYFLSSSGAGTHDLVFGYDTFTDIRFAVNHQTGSDFTVYASDIIVDANNNIFPQFLGTDVWVRWFAVFNLDIARPTDFVTNSYYVNDSWQLNDKWSFNIGVRYDENDGTNASGALVADDAKWSQRLGATYDVKGDGDLTLHASWGTYVAALANTRGNSTNEGGAIGSLVSRYGGPIINPDRSCAAAGTCTTTSEALQILFDWYFANGGTDDVNGDLTQIPGLFSQSIPGVTAVIQDTIKSPSQEEISLGVSKRLGSKGLFRADLVFREWDDFYSNKTTIETGTVQTPTGPDDLTLVGNFGNDFLSREYQGLHTNFSYRLSDRLTFSGNYTLSQTEGNINGESGNGGPGTSSPQNYPEYSQVSWGDPVGDLRTDQRHKLRVWGIYDLIENERHNLSASLLWNYFSGQPYNAAGSVDTRPNVTNPGYINPPTSVTYFYTDRDAFRTDDIARLDFALNYSFRWNLFGKSLEVFLQPEILNVFNEDGVIDVNENTRDAVTNSSTGCNGAPCQTFNPFTTTPIEGVHWAKRSTFGLPQNEDDYQFPRIFRFSVGFRF